MEIVSSRSTWTVRYDMAHTAFHRHLPLHLLRGVSRVEVEEHRVCELMQSLGITLYFVIPRVPSFTFYTPTPFTVDNSTIEFSRSPTNFSFNGNLNLYGMFTHPGTSSTCINLCIPADS